MFVFNIRSQTMNLSLPIYRLFPIGVCQWSGAAARRPLFVSVRKKVSRKSVFQKSKIPPCAPTSPPDNESFLYACCKMAIRKKVLILLYISLLFLYYRPYGTNSAHVRFFPKFYNFFYCKYCRGALICLWINHPSTFRRSFSWQGLRYPAICTTEKARSKS